MFTVPPSLQSAQPTTEALALAFIDLWAISSNARQFGDPETSSDTLFIVGDQALRISQTPIGYIYAFGSVEFNDLGVDFTLTEGPFAKGGGFDA